MATRSKRRGGADGKRPRAVVVLGHVEETDSFWPGHTLPFSRKAEEYAQALERKGYEVRMYREPTKKQLRRVLRDARVRAVALVGHGAVSRGRYSFELEKKNNLGAHELAEWAHEDVVMKRKLHRSRSARVKPGTVAHDALERCASYNFDLAIGHTCHSYADPELRRAFGGRFEGNPWYSTINLPTWYSVEQRRLGVDPSLFERAPETALRSALTREVRGGGRGKAARSRVSACVGALEDMGRATKKRRAGSRARTRAAVSALQRHFTVDLDEGVRDPEVDETEARDVVREARERVRLCSEPCDMPTQSSKGKRGCRRSVLGGGPCWQH